MTEDERQRIRDLQRRAYGPGGGLSPAEAQELAELQDAARPPVPRSTADLPSGVVERARNERDETVSDVGEADGVSSRSARSTTDGGEGVSSRSARSTTRGHRILLTVVAAASALLIGLGAGWLLFGRGTGPAMDAEQQEAWAQLEASGDYDAGSIRMLGEKYGITAWYATQGETKLECLLLTPDTDNTISCAPAPDPKNTDDDQDGWGQLSAQTRLRDEQGSIVQAIVARDIQGDLTVIMNKWGMTFGDDDWTANFTGTELDIAKTIVAAGYEGNYLRIVGYDGETPIWYEDSANCLLVADTTHLIAKGCDIQADIPGTRLTMPGVTYELRNTPNGQFLTVIRGGEPSDPAIDDTTGKKSQ
ncbi:hypothetical protein L2X99_10140 [Microbacterium sp. KUDC0406]|uniref:hypothetical protein n=1 Tax=Microbacterium sp. KUDC0406 TaxID=2909588 RepID=UPI001F1C5C7B|nr:hypothetical protein [Microbacterium sp. KUDC0406]UJP08856.1 hypothetical protein L2X99_10140 [Microbacterium sp. KUDC0406]